MSHLTRRTLIGGTAALAAQALAQNTQQPVTGTLKTRTSKQIAASPISIGFETLDRMMFDPERTYEWIAQTGVKWARCQTGWGRTEKVRGQYDFAWLDGVVNKLLSLGIQPWFNVGYGNQLYTPAAPHFSAVGWVPIYDDAALDAWKLYVNALGTHFAGRVTHWEMWNEPNIPNFWQPRKCDPADYVRLVAATALAVRKAVPNAKIIGGVVAGLGDNFDFIEGCVKAGLTTHIDRFSYHPYRQRPELHYNEDIRMLRGILNTGKPNIPLWQGENGAPSEPKGFGALAELNWNEDAQASWLLRRLITDVSLGVEVTSYFLIVDLANYVAAQGVDGRTNFKGVLRATDYKPKKSFRALQNVCTLFDRDTTVANHELRFNNTKGADEITIRQANFTRSGKPILTYWYPSNLPDAFSPGTTRITAWTGSDVQITNPVMVDMRDGAIRPLKGGRRTGGWVFPDMPLNDWPVLITDASVVA
jgi:hypothetical protein